MQNLFRKYIDNQCSPAEVKELLQYFSAGENELLLRSLISEKLGFIDSDDDGSQLTQATDNVYTAIKKQIDREKIKVVPIFRRTWFRVAAAAVLLVGAFALYKTVGNNKSPQQKIVKTNTEKQDIAPGGNKAVLTLADGSQIILDSAANGNLASQGNTKVIKLDNGQLAYNASGTATEILYNTVSTPRGGQYNLTLADGSRVWLNAASSLRYPASFSGNERKVELTGEGYFEVAPSISPKGGGKQRFIVDVAGKGEVEVLGTHFNINAYADESSINTTLLEGKVKVTPVTNSQLVTQNSQLLSPGQQAQISTGIKVINNVDTDPIIAWKAGLFHFVRADVKTIMRQIGRWYDVDVQFEGDISKKTFSAIVNRSNNISEVLKIMKEAGIQFRIVDKKIIVTN